MASALSPSMINIQVPFADAGHLKAPGYLSQPTSSAPSPQKKQRHSSPSKRRSLTPSVSASSSPLKKGRTGFKRTTSTANIMDTVMNSRVATDHDAVPAFGLGIPTSTSNIFEYSRSSPIASSSQTTLADLENDEAANVLSTPRRGKRVGNVHMGWESPLDADQTPTAASVAGTAPHTLPKSSRTRASAQSVSVEASPSKRKASTAFASELRLSRRSLVDTAGWASAAMISSVPLAEDRINSSPGFSPRFVPEPVMTGLITAETRDPLAAFINDASPVCSQNPRLVPVEVEGLGRVAVHPDFAQQIAESPCAAQSDAQRRFSTASEREAALLRGSDSEDSAARSDNGSSTDPTSAGTPCPSGVSPSFSLSSQFPCSEPRSPTKKGAMAASYSEHHASDTQKALSALMRVASPDAVAQQEARLWCPRLGGSTATTVAKLPILDWPDRPDGPWSAAGRHIDELKQKRRQGIQRWLESDSADETQDDAQESSGAAYRHHPMVAKALLDRARKQHRTQMSSAVVAAASAISPSKRGRKPKQPHLLHVQETPSKRRGRKPKVAASIASSSRKSVATGASLARSNTSAIIGCKCGIDDDSIIMVQCDGCRSWLHLPCVGVNTVNDLDDEWYCDECCDAALTEHLSPASSMPTSIGSYAHLSTPEALEAALAGQEPVFTLPSGTPIHRYGVAVSSSIALAPSPPLLSVGDRGGRSTAKRQGQGRSRAERVGWRINEPGSPLARKSTTASSGVRPAVPETPSKSSEATVDFTDASATPSLLAGFSRADWEPTRARRASERQTTPTRVLGVSTPSRHASGRKPSHSGPLSLGLCDDEPPHADLFSTPSRLASGGSWAYRAGGQPLGSQTPSRSGGRHQRIDSFSGGLLSTPGRDFLSGAFGTEPSTSMPSLVYSSGYIDGLDDHLSGDGFYSGSNSRAWQLQSPTSSTRAARARQPSGFGTPWSSSLLKTPELQPRQAHTSSVRSGRYDTSDDFPPSSSPFPRTPTFDMSSPRLTPHGSHHSSGAHERHPSHLGLGLPSSSSARLHKALGADLHKGGASRDDRSLSASAHAKHRQVSTEVPMGLGIGLDLDDVLDWS